MTEDQELTLSEAGCRRRDAMLEQLTSLVQVHHRRRRMRRRVAVAGVATLMIAAMSIAVTSLQPNNTPSPRVADVRPGPSAIQVQFIATDHSIEDRYRVQATAVQITILSDENLLDALAQLGRPAGLVHMDDRTWLTCDVADPM